MAFSVISAMDGSPAVSSARYTSYCIWLYSNIPDNNNNNDDDDDDDDEEEEEEEEEDINNNNTAASTFGLADTKNHIKGAT